LVLLSPDAILLFQDARLVFVNAAGARLLRAPDVRNLLGLPASRLVHPNFVEHGLIGNEHVAMGSNTVAPVEVKYLC
jgi:hypothetical protein